MSDKWKPWIDHSKAEQPTLPIDEPPCKTCKWFRPVANFNAAGQVEGVTLCHAPEMYSDFSCHKVRE